MGRRSCLAITTAIHPYPACKNPCFPVLHPRSVHKFMVDSSPHLWVGITDYDWFKLHASKESVDEVNFWKPSSQPGFKVLHWGEHSSSSFTLSGISSWAAASSQSFSDSPLVLPGTRLANPMAYDRCTTCVCIGKYCVKHPLPWIQREGINQDSSRRSFAGAKSGL